MISTRSNDAEAECPSSRFAGGRRTAPPDPMDQGRTYTLRRIITVLYARSVSELPKLSLDRLHRHWRDAVTRSGE